MDTVDKSAEALCPQGIPGSEPVDNGVDNLGIIGTP